MPHRRSGRRRSKRLWRMEFPNIHTLTRLLARNDRVLAYELFAREGLTGITYVAKGRTELIDWLVKSRALKLDGEVVVDTTVPNPYDFVKYVPLPLIVYVKVIDYPLHLLKLVLIEFLADGRQRYAQLRIVVDMKPRYGQ